MVASRDYATLSPNPVNEDPSTEAAAFASAPVGDRVSLTVQHSLTRLHQGLTHSRSGVLSNVHLAHNVDLTAGVITVRDDRGRGREAYVAVTVLLGRSTASAAHLRDQRGNRIAVDAQRPLPVGEGYGYQMHAESGATGVTTGVAKLQGRHGRYELRQESVGGEANTTVSAMGSIVGIGGGVYASRPVQDSFALIRVPGVEGVRGFSSHQSVGKTGRNGDLLVPDLQAYYGNLLDVADGDIPLAYSIANVGQTLAPPYRGGAVALFNVHKTQRVVGTITISETSVNRIPSFGDISITASGREVSSPVGRTGAFYFEDLPAGTHTATVRDADGSECTFTISVPSSRDVVMSVGTLRCEVRVQ
jgi:outer membrane usher protein